MTAHSLYPRGLPDISVSAAGPLANNTDGDPSTTPLSLGASLFLMAGSFIFMVAALVVTFALVRMRANYNPLSVGLENGLPKFTSPQPLSLFATVGRTYRIEGVGGLFKGIVPTFILIMLASVASLIGTFMFGWLHLPKIAGVTAVNGIIVLAATPGVLIANRCIVTPYRLRNVRAALRIVLSPYENANILALYPPGLVIATLLQLIAFSVSTAVGIYADSLPQGDDKDVSPAQVLRGLLFVVFQILSTTWQCPLEVAIVKLSVQPNLGDDQYHPGDEQDDREEYIREVEHYNMDEDVVTLRPETEPYTGLIDCFRKIANEEGPAALYRGWIWTCLALIAVALPSAWFMPL